MRYRTIGTGENARRDVSSLCLGAMLFGTSTDEPTAFALLDRFVEAGGTFVDTANNYAFWLTGSQGGESEALLGRWRASRGITDEVVIATKHGGRMRAPGTSFEDAARRESIEGLSAAAIRDQAQRSRAALGVERIDLLYAHFDDVAVPQDETVDAFAQLVADGDVGLLGASNHWAWRLDRARSHAARAGVPGYDVLQYHYSYLRPRNDRPGRRSPDGEPGVMGGDVLSYLRAHPELTAVVYSPLLRGAYIREDRLDAMYQHSGTEPQLAALRDVARATGATANQVVLAWLLGGDVPLIPLIGASSLAQLDESLASADLELTAEQRAQLDEASG